MTGIIVILIAAAIIVFVAYKVLQHSGRLATLEADLAKLKAKLP